MKHLSLLLLLICLATLTMAKPKSSIAKHYGTLINGHDHTLSDDVLYLPTIASLQAYNGTITTVIVSDSLRGGTFNYITTPQVIDNGVIFAATGKGSGYWRRQFDGVHVEATWYGLLPDGVTDNSTLFKAMLRAAAAKKQTINFRNGIYLLPTWSTDSVNYVHFTGAGRYDVTLKGHNTDFIKTFRNADIFLRGITIRGFNSAIRSYDTVKNYNVQFCRFMDMRAHSLLAADIATTPNSYIVQGAFNFNEVTNASGFYLQAGIGQVEAIGNQMYNLRRDTTIFTDHNDNKTFQVFGIAIGSSTNVGRDTGQFSETHIRIIGNSIKGITNYSTTGLPTQTQGIGLFGINGIISGNTVENVYCGIKQDIYGIYIKAANTIIDGNTVVNCTRDSVSTANIMIKGVNRSKYQYAAASYDVIVSNNVIKGSSSQKNSIGIGFITGTDVRMVNNTIDTMYFAGISMTSSDPKFQSVPSRVEISGNTLNNMLGQYGVNINASGQTGSNNDMSDIKVLSNHINHTPRNDKVGSAGSGIRAFTSGAANNIIIKDNDVTFAADSLKIKVYNSIAIEAATNSTNWTIQGNRYNNLGSTVNPTLIYLAIPIGQTVDNLRITNEQYIGNTSNFTKVRLNGSTLTGTSALLTNVISNGFISPMAADQFPIDFDNSATVTVTKPAQIAGTNPKFSFAVKNPNPTTSGGSILYSTGVGYNGNRDNIGYDETNKILTMYRVGNGFRFNAGFGNYRAGFRSNMNNDLIFGYSSENDSWHLFGSSGNLVIGNSTALLDNGLAGLQISRTIWLSSVTANSIMATNNNQVVGAVSIGSNMDLSSNVLSFKPLQASSSINFPATAPNTYSEQTTTITGAAVGDVVVIGIDAASVPNKNCNFIAWVSSTNTVTIRFCNNDPSTTVDPAAGLFNIKIIK